MLEHSAKRRWRPYVPAFVAAAVLLSSHLAVAADKQVFVVAGHTYTITVGTLSTTVPSTSLTPGGQPAASPFTFHASPIGAGYITVHSTVAGQEPLVATALSPPSGTFTAGANAAPYEVGFGSLVFTGVAGSFSATGSSISAGVIGVGEATYVTSPGDTASNIFSQLVALLNAQGVEASESSTALSVFSDQSDPASVDGAITFFSNDPLRPSTRRSEVSFRNLDPRVCW